MQLASLPSVKKALFDSSNLSVKKQPEEANVLLTLKLDSLNAQAAVHSAKLRLEKQRKEYEDVVQKQLSPNVIEEQMEAYLFAQRQHMQATEKFAQAQRNERNLWDQIRKAAATGPVAPLVELKSSSPTDPSVNCGPFFLPSAADITNMGACSPKLPCSVLRPDLIGTMSPGLQAIQEVVNELGEIGPHHFNLSAPPLSRDVANVSTMSHPSSVVLQLPSKSTSQVRKDWPLCKCGLPARLNKKLRTPVYVCPAVDLRRRSNPDGCDFVLPMKEEQENPLREFDIEQEGEGQSGLDVEVNQNVLQNEREQLGDALLKCTQIFELYGIPVPPLVKDAAKLASNKRQRLNAS